MNSSGQTQAAGIELVKLDSIFASFDVKSGRWSKIALVPGQVVSSGRTDQTLQDVSRRVELLAHVEPTTPLFLRMTRSEKLLEEYRKNLIEPTIKEFEAHQKYLLSIKDKVCKHVQREWQWHCSLPIIGYIFEFVMNQALANLDHRFTELTSVLAQKVKTLCQVKDKFVIAEHVTELLEEDDFLSKAYKDVDKVQAEAFLILAKANTTKKVGNVLLRRDFDNPERFILSELRNAVGSQAQHFPFEVIRIHATEYKYEAPIDPQNPRYGKFTFTTRGLLREHLFRNSQDDGMQTPDSFESSPGTPILRD
jgi:hypothetical protein